MEFKQQTGAIVAEESGKEVGSLKFRELDENTLEAYSTFVDDSQRGKGLARQLVDQLVEVAKVDGKKIKPTCSYVVNLFEKEPENYGDIEAK